MRLHRAARGVDGHSRSAPTKLQRHAGRRLLVASVRCDVRARWCLDVR
jgi:hypothetical protein